MSTDRDPYALLGVPPDASPVDIARAYRRRVRDLHPDTHPDDPAAGELLRAVTDAYGELADADRRAAYDRSRRATSPPAHAEPLRARPGLVAQPPLWAGPVRVEPSPDARARPADHRDDLAPLLAWLTGALRRWPR